MEVQEKKTVMWRQLALEEIASIKPQFARRHEWQFETHEEQDKVNLFICMRHNRHTDRVRVLKLTYGPGFPRERPRESFVDPNDYDNEGLEHWIDDNNQAFKSKHNPPVICLEGTWGFHQVLHKDRDPFRASLNKLLLELQQCFNKTP